MYIAHVQHRHACTYVHVHVRTRTARARGGLHKTCIQTAVLYAICVYDSTTLTYVEFEHAQSKCACSLGSFLASAQINLQRLPQNSKLQDCQSANKLQVHSQRSQICLRLSYSLHQLTLVLSTSSW